MSSRDTHTAATFDHVIIGAGSAGCVVANRLSADPGLNICLIEAGGQDSHPWMKIPVGYFYNFDHPRADWRFRTEPEIGLKGRVLKYPRGRVLGGSSSINATVYIRGNAVDYDGWRDEGNSGWGWADVLPYFMKSEDQSRGASLTHGTGGEMRIEDLRASWEILDIFREAGIQRGIPASDDFNSGDNTGIGYFQITQKNGLRVSSATAFLKPAKRRANLSIMKQCTVTRILISERRAVGVEIECGGERRIIRAAKEVILSAGSIGSPHILQLSGIGDPELLHRYGIKVEHPLPAVGENLQDHAAVRMMFRVGNTVTLNDQLRSPLAKARMLLSFAFFRRGPLTMPAALVNAFVKSDPTKISPDLQYVVYPLTYDAVGTPAHRFSAFTASVCLINPMSRGYVRLRSASHSVPPAITLNLMTSEEDMKTAVAGVRKIREICSAPAFEPFQLKEFRIGAERIADEDIAEGIRESTSTIFHPTGTCRMGSDKYSVVTPELRLRGIEGLRVVDASIMPRIVSGNTNAATVMIAEKASDLILKK